MAELLRAGATYYSDEFAVFDARGRVHPYPKPLSIREKNGNRARSVPADELLANTVPVRRRPEASLATLQQIVSDSLILKGVRGEASEMADSLLTMGA